MSSPQLTAFERLLASKTNANDPDFKPVLARLRSELSDRLENSSPAECFDFFVSCLNALSKVKGTSHSEVRLQCAADIGFFFVAHGYERLGLSAIDDFATLAQQTGKKHWIRKAETFTGLAHMDVGNIAQAIVSLSKAWEIAREINDSTGQMSVLNNLGTALNYAAQYREAIPYLELVIQLAKEHCSTQRHFDRLITTDDFLCRGLSNLAQSHFYLQDFDRAYEAIQASMSLSVEPLNAPSTMSRVVREYTFVEIALEVGETQAARSHLHACERYAKDRGPRAMLLADISRGLVEAYAGDAALGVRILENVVRYPELADSVRQPALLAVVRACEHAGLPELALSYMKELLEHIRRRREKSFEAVVLPDVIRPDRASDVPDLHGLRLTEERLRAKVAERSAAGARIEMLERLAVTADLKEEASGAHGYRVGKLASLLATQLGWDLDVRNALELAARLHDIGKIGVPDRILLKTQNLRDAERDMMSIHAVIGAELLAKSAIPQLRMAEDIARYHHEWWNGSGYPAKLAGKRIPLHARIVALADVFDALTHGRPYAPAWPIEKAVEEIQARRGTQFDPELTDRFVELVQRLQKEHPDLDELLGRAGRNSPFAQARNRIRLMLEEGRERIEKQTAPASETVH